MKVRIEAELCHGKDLQPGDLFSNMGPAYWDLFGANGSIGERLYVRTANPPRTDEDPEMYRITIHRETDHATQ